MAKRYLGGGISFEQKDVYQEFSEDEGGGVSTTLAGLTDVDISNPTNGDTLVYNSTTEKWENGEGGGGSSTLAGLTDVDISEPADGQTLVYNATSGKWENGSGGGGGGVHVIGTQTIENVVALTVTAGQLYGWLDNGDYVLIEKPDGDWRAFEPILAYMFNDQDGYAFEFSQDEYIAANAADYPTLPL